VSYPPQQVPYGSGPAGEQYPPQQGVGWAPHSGVPAPQPPKRKRTGLVIGIVAGALAVLLGVAVTLVVVLQPKEVQVGDCIDVFDEQASRVERVKCGSAESDYDVVGILGYEAEDCPGSFSVVNDGKTYCVLLDVEVGDCLSTYVEDELPIKLDCSDPKTEDQVTKVEPNGDPEAVCAEGEGWYSAETPPRTVCFGDKQNA
jgi:hypothetical protein